MALICTVIGLLAGWHVGYTRPASRMEHIFSQGQKITGMSEEQMVRWIPHAVQTAESIERMQASASLETLGFLGQGNTQRVEERLTFCLGRYYHDYHAPYDGDSNLLARIEAAAATNKFLAKSIEESKYCR
jgi:hypothetical protein